MSDRLRNFIVGLASIASLGILATLLMLFGELDAILKPRYEVLVQTDNAAGLRPGSLVELNGVPVGVVDTVRVESGIEFPVSIVALIDPATRVPDNAATFVTSSLIGGVASLQFRPPGQEQPSQTYLPTDGSASVTGPIRFRLYEDINAALDARMDPIVDALDEFEQLAKTYNEVGENLNALLQPAGDGDAPSLHTSVARFNEVLSDIQEALQLAQDWLGDEQLRADAQDAVAKANDLIDRAADAVDQYAQLADSLEGDSKRVVEEFTRISDELAVTLEDVHRLTNTALHGDGTLAELLNNPDLYNSLNDAAVRLERALTQAQLLIEKIKAEGLNINL